MKHSPPLLTKERDQKVTLVEQYSQTAADEGRDLTENEISTIKKARSRVTEIDGQLAVLADDLTMSDEISSKLRMLAPQAPRRDRPLPHRRRHPVRPAPPDRRRVARPTLRRQRQEACRRAHGHRRRPHQDRRR